MCPGIKKLQKQLSGKAREINYRIEAAKKEWEVTVDSLSEIICLLDKSGRIMRANLAVERWGLDGVRKLKGKTPHQLLHPTCTDKNCAIKFFLEKSWRQIQNRETALLETLDNKRNQFLRIKIQSISAHKNPTVDCAAVAIIEDIGQHKKIENQLVDLYKHIGAINRRVSILLEVAKTKETENKKEILQQLLQSALEISKARIVALYGYDQLADRFTLLSSKLHHQTKNNRRPGRYFSPELSQNLAAQLHGKSWIEINHSEPYSREFGLTAAEDNFLIFPLNKDGSLASVMIFGFPGKNVVTTQDIDFLNIFAFQSLLFLVNNNILE